MEVLWSLLDHCRVGKLDEAVDNSQDRTVLGAQGKAEGGASFVPGLAQPILTVWAQFPKLRPRPSLISGVAE